MWQKHDSAGATGMMTTLGDFDPSLPSLLCVHGSGGGAVEFAPLLAYLSGRVNACAVDLLGHGATPGPSRSRVADYAAWVGDFLAAGPVRPVLLGHSLGGAIALTLALTRPELLGGLILWGTGARLRVLPAILEGLAGDPQNTLSLIIDHAYAGETDLAVKLAGRARLSRTDPRVTLGDYSACDAFDVMARLGEIKAPTLVACGADDRLTPPKYSLFLCERIPGARLVIIPHAGHMLHEEEPLAGAQAIADFLTSM